MFILPGLSDLYYVRLQNLDPVNLPLVRVAALALALYPVCVAVRAQGEGLAGLAGKPMTVIAGQVMFMATILLTGGVLWSLGIDGNLIGGIGMCFGNLVSTATLRLLLRWIRKADPASSAEISGHRSDAVDAHEKEVGQEPQDSDQKKLETNGDNR
jgi:hypothetical protein